MTGDSEPSAGPMDDFIRPFLVTGGRTRSAVEGLRIETMVQRKNVDGSTLRFESARVFELCNEPVSLAEISAHLRLPTGTVKVVVGDLLNSGFLEQFRTLTGAGDNGSGDAGDIELITRLIEGVRRL